jgi:hypothetical protein
MALLRLEAPGKRREKLDQKRTFYIQLSDNIVQDKELGHEQQGHAK